MRALRAICQTQESATNDGWFGRNFGRKLTLPVSWLLLHTPISANQTTLLWLLFDLGAGAFLLVGTYWSCLIGAALMILAYILDGTDGEIARFNKQSSLKGAYLDRLCHNIAYPFILSSISWGTYRHAGDKTTLLFGYLATIFFILIWLVDLEKIKILRHLKQSCNDNPQPKLKHSRFKTIISRFLRAVIAVVDPTNVELIIAGTILFAVLDKLVIFITILGILMPIKWCIQVYHHLNSDFK